VRRPFAFYALLALPALVTCRDPGGPEPFEPGRIVVLNGQGETGVTILARAEQGLRHLSFPEFDGASFALRNDTVISAASKAKGDLLYVGILNTGKVITIQLPPGSNPAGAVFAEGPVFGLPDVPGTRIFVALRDSTRAVSVLLPADSSDPVIYRQPHAGTCPVDVVSTPTKVWYLDANQRCQSDYAILGPSRLIPPLNLGTSDTMTLLSAVVGAQRAFVVGNFAYVLSAGDFGITPGSLTKIDLTTRNSIVVPLPPNRYGVSLRIGENGHAYVTDTPAWPDIGPRVYAIHLETMNFGGERVAGQFHLKLAKTSGGEGQCYAATADADGRVYCLENGNVVAMVVVFNPDGNEIYKRNAGSLAYDITLR
jgi:hypothetical protein